MSCKVKRKNDTQIKKDLSKRFCTKEPKFMARLIRLNVRADDVIPGDGNCFYHTLLQQLQRSDIAIDYHSSHLNLDPLPSHQELRTAICEYVQ